MWEGTHASYEYIMLICSAKPHIWKIEFVFTKLELQWGVLEAVSLLLSTGTLWCTFTHCSYRWFWIYPFLQKLILDKIAPVIFDFQRTSEASNEQEFKYEVIVKIVITEKQRAVKCC